MKKNLLLLGLLVFIFAGCDTGTGSGTKDTWSEITSMSQLEGKWEGTAQSQPILLKDIVEASGLLDDPELLAELLGIEDPVWLLMINPEMIAVIIKDINVTITVKATITFVADDYDAGSMSGTTNTTVSLSDGSTNMLWDMIIQEISLEDLPPGVSINNKNHSITMDSDVPFTPISLDDFEGSQINQTGKKLRTELDTSALEEFDEIGVFESFVPSEIILYKK